MVSFNLGMAACRFHQRLILHQAHIDTQAGRDYFLKCVEINKLDSIALGGCTWFDQTGKDDGKRDGSSKEKWWATFCSTVRTNAFGLRELVVEGLERGESGRGMYAYLQNWSCLEVTVHERSP